MTTSPQTRAQTRADFRFVHGRKSRIGSDAPSVRAFRWWFAQLTDDNTNPDDVPVDFRHEGRCGRCGRTLTVPASIDTGFGPSCAAYLFVPWVEKHRHTQPPFHPIGFALAGNAVFTITSRETGTRFTYRVRRAPDDGRSSRPWFVSVLTGPDNTRNFQYIGMVWEG